MEIKQLKKRRLELLIKLDGDLNEEELSRVRDEYENINKMIRKSRKPDKNPKMMRLAQENGIHQQTYYARVKSGMTEFEAATKPLQRRTNGEMRKWVELAKKNGISKSAFQYKLYQKKMKPEDAATVQFENKTERQKWLPVALKNGIKEATFDSRSYKAGWDYERAATEPVKNAVTPNSPNRKLIRIRELCKQSDGYVSVDDLMKIMEGKT